MVHFAVDLELKRSVVDETSNRIFLTLCVLFLYPLISPTLYTRSISLEHFMIRRTISIVLACTGLVAILIGTSAVATSPTWTDRDSSMGDLFEVAYGGGKFVALSDGSSTISGAKIIAKTSTAGDTWTSHTKSTSLTPWKIAYGGTAGNEVFVMVPYGGNKILKSTDGESWVEVPAVQGNWVGVAYGNGTFVAVAPSKVMYSTDNADTWTELLSAQEPDIAGSWESIAFGGTTGNKKFVVVGRGSSGGDNRVSASSDGINWVVRRQEPATPAPGSIDPAWYSVTYGGGYFVAVANVGNCNSNFYACAEGVMRSSDGVTWNRVTLPTEAQGKCWMDVTYGEIDGIGTFIAVGDCGTHRVMTSTDGGATWIADGSASTGGWFGIAYGNGVFVAVGYDSTKSCRLVLLFLPPQQLQHQRLLLKQQQQLLRHRQ